jgi:hypothetical protein
MERCLKILWLERGVEERGGLAPSQILSPLSNISSLIMIGKPV